MSTKIAKTENFERLHTFVTSLNEIFSPIKGQILKEKPLLNIEEAIKKNSKDNSHQRMKAMQSLLPNRTLRLQQRLIAQRKTLNSTVPGAKEHHTILTHATMNMLSC